MPSESDLEFDLFVEAFERYQAAKKSHDDARGRYSGYSWGYYGRDEIESMNEARKKVMECFREIVRSEVKAALEQGNEDATVD